MFFRSAKSRRSVRTTNSRKLTLEGLEGRRLMAGDLSSINPPAPITAPVAPAAFDTTLTAVLRQSSFDSVGKTEVFIDGSDYRDVVRINDFTPGSLGVISVTLEQYSNNNILISSKTIRLHSSTFAASYQVNVLGRGGNDDIVNMTQANMYADGGEGQDFLSGGTSYDYLIGGPGMNTLYGNDGSDGITGGDDADMIYGGAGDDYINGNGGNDTIYGDSGSENPLFAGKDTIYGGAGSDKIWGNAGDDKIWGGDDSDTIDGGLGNDTIYGGNGNDTLFGQSGADQLYGESGRDKLYGGADDDYLDGGFWSSDSLNEADELWGGAGADSFVKYRVHFGFDDIDVFADYNPSTLDKIIEKRSWF